MRVLIQVSAGGVTAFRVSDDERGQCEQPLIYYGSDPTYEKLSNDYHNCFAIPEPIRQYVAGVLGVEYKLYADTERRPTYLQVRSLDEAVKHFYSLDNKSTSIKDHHKLIVQVMFPLGGYFRVQHAGSMYGYAGWQLIEVLSQKEAVAIHDEASKAASAGRFDNHAHRSPLVHAFERLEKYEEELYGLLPPAVAAS